MSIPHVRFNPGIASMGDVAMAALMRRLLAALIDKGIFSRQELDGILTAAILDIDASVLVNIPADEWHTKLHAKAMLQSIASGRDFGF